MLRTDLAGWTVPVTDRHLEQRRTQAVEVEGAVTVVTQQQTTVVTLASTHLTLL